VTPVPYNPPPQPSYADVADNVARLAHPVRVNVVAGTPGPAQQALTIVKNVVVIVTCLAVLYTLYAGYSALQELGDTMRQVGL
jgi:hypothetical protein